MRPSGLSYEIKNPLLQNASDEISAVPPKFLS